MKKSILILFLLTSWMGFSQNDSIKKHNMFFYWGYNRSAYSKSNLRLFGEGYNFVMQDVSGRDKPEEFDPNVYFNILKLSIPQFNIRAGYQISDKLWISGGYDHMKYVVRTDQTVSTSGFISSDASIDHSGRYSNDSIQISTDFLTFEHTDGLNFVSIDLDYVQPIWESENKKYDLELRFGGSLGILYPRTDVRIFGEKGPNIWNFAGYGIAGKSQFRFHFLKHFFLQGTFKPGWINMPWISTTGNANEGAQQNFWFIEGFWALGGRWSW